MSGCKQIYRSLLQAISQGTHCFNVYEAFLIQTVNVKIYFLKSKFKSQMHIDEK